LGAPAGFEPTSSVCVVLSTQLSLYCNEPLGESLIRFQGPELNLTKNLSLSLDWAFLPHPTV